MKKGTLDKHIHAGHRQRLRENVDKNGLLNMHDHQVLEYMLTFVMPQKDVNELAHRLINRFGSFSNVLEADVSLLKSVSGVGDVIAHFLHNFRDMFYYYQKNKVNNITTLCNSDQTGAYFTALLGDKVLEELHMVGLDSQNRIVFSMAVERGTSNYLSVTTRKITNIVISRGIDNVIIAHNHPAGMCLPSIQDDTFTKKLFVALGTNGIALLDHIIIGNDGFYSYQLASKMYDLMDEYKDMLHTGDLAQKRAKYFAGDKLHEDV